MPPDITIPRHTCTPGIRYGCLLLMTLLLSSCIVYPWNQDVPFTIYIASGGGFTGQITGHTLHSDGTIINWQQFPGREKIITAEFRATRAQIAGIHQQLMAPAIMNTIVADTGNMTVTVVYTEQDKTRSWSWDASLIQDPQDKQTTIQNWYHQTTLFCQTLTNQGQ